MKNSVRKVIGGAVATAIIGAGMFGMAVPAMAATPLAMCV